MDYLYECFANKILKSKKALKDILKKLACKLKINIINQINIQLNPQAKN